MELTKKEEAWLARFRKTMEAAPTSLSKKVSSYTIGDSDIHLYDLDKFTSYFETNAEGEDYHCTLVERSGSSIESVNFPFSVEATAG